MKIFAPLLFVLFGPPGIHDPSITPASYGMQQLVCRGKPGLEIRVSQNPSPMSVNYVRMVMQYAKPTPPVGTNYEHLAPGACSWNPHNFSGVPPEPGVIYIDISPQAQRWAGPETRQLDTTANAALYFPDTISLRRYMGHADHLYSFYVDDKTNISSSHGALADRTAGPQYVTITGPYPPPAKVGDRKPGDPSQSTTRSQPAAVAGKPRTPGAATTPAAAKLAKLTFKGLDRAPNGFTVHFTARPNASVSVRYSTDRPTNTPTGWYFGGAAITGSGGMSRGGFAADVSTIKSGSLFSEYAGKSRLPIQPGTSYSFVITVEGGGPLEQYVGQFRSMQKDIFITMASFTVLKKSFDQQVSKGIQVFRNDAGKFSYCGDSSCDNSPDVIGILVWAGPTFGRGVAPPPTSWTVVPGLNSGVGKLTMDTRAITPDRPFRPFTIKSASGDVEFEAIGEVRVTWK